MMLTREQAAATWCPMVRIARVEVVEFSTKPDEKHMVAGCNTDALGRNRVPASCRCIADQCAMWRWMPMDTSGPLYELSSLMDRHGYCGLAGAPFIAGGAS